MAEMKKNMRPFANRLTRRIILLWILMMSVISAIVFFRAKSGMAEQADIHYGDVLDLTNEKVEGILRSVEVSAVNVREGVERNLSSPSAVYASLEQELQLNPHLRGCVIAFIENYFPSEGRWFEPYVGRERDGSIEHYQVASEQHDYSGSEQFRSSIVTGEDYWTEPSKYDSGSKMVYCTYFLPAHDKDGKIVGMLGVVASLEWLTEQMQEIDVIVNERSNVPDNAVHRPYSFLLDRDGDYLAHPDAEMLEKNYFDFNETAAGKQDSDYVHIGHEMLAGNKGQASTVIDGVPSHVYYAPIEKTGWSVGIVVPQAVLLRSGIKLGYILLGLMLLGMIVIALSSFFMIKRTAKPLQFLAQSAKEVAKGDFKTPLPEIRHNDEIRQLRDSFADMETSLSEYVRELKATTARQASMESELSIAREIQMAMLPKGLSQYPDREDIDIHASLTPAKAVGGDLYDFLIRDGQLYFCIGDVSGKGVPAALVMSMISTQFRSLSSSENSPEKIVSAINTSAEGRTDSMMFATLFVGILDLSTGILSYCNAGHNAPVLAGKEPRFLKVEANLPVAVESGWKYKGQHHTLAPDTTLLLYTDGLSEAENRDKDQFGEQRILDTLRQTKADTAETTVNALTDAVHRFVGKAEQSDDLTMLAIRFKGPAK